MPGVYVIEDDFSKIGLPLLPLDPRATHKSVQREVITRSNEWVPSSQCSVQNSVRVPNPGKRKRSRLRFYSHRIKPMNRANQMLQFLRTPRCTPAATLRPRTITFLNGAVGADGRKSTIRHGGS